MTPAESEPDEKSFFARLADVGSVAQASVPGVYAWAVTVAPVAWSRAGGLGSRAAAIAALASLGAGVVLEGVGRTRTARLVSVWGLTLLSAVAWAIAQSGPSAGRIDAARGISGMLAWGLFAYASAAPTFRRSPASPEFEEGENAQLQARGRSPRGDRYYLIGAAVAATLLQFVGWVPASPERALLVRLVTVAAGVALVSSAAQVTLARHKRGQPVSSRSRRRMVILSLGAVGVVVLAGAIVVLVR
jgi:hypothetical protein